MSDQITNAVRTKCEVIGRRILPCAHADAAGEVGGRGARRQGLKFTTMMRLTDEKTRDALTLISGDFNEGAIVRFCPFCGASVVTEYACEEGADV